MADASISLGYISIHETVNALYGNETHVYDSKEHPRQKAVAIVKRLRYATDASGRKKQVTVFSLYRHTKRKTYVAVSVQLILKSSVLFLALQTKVTTPTVSISMLRRKLTRTIRSILKCHTQI